VDGSPRRRRRRNAEATRRQLSGVTKQVCRADVAKGLI
jgi:hypothetical protein